MSILKKIENYFQSEEQKKQNKEIRLKIEMVDRNLFETKKLIQSVLNIMKKNKMAGDEIEKRLSKLESLKDNPIVSAHKFITYDKETNAYFVHSDSFAKRINPHEIIARAKKSLINSAPEIKVKIAPEPKVRTAAGEFIWEKPAPIPEQIKPKRGRKPGKSKLDPFKADIIKDYKLRKPLKDICEKYEISAAAFYRWLKNNSSMLSFRDKRR